MTVATALLGLATAVGVIAVHELAHLCTGLAVGFRFSVFAIGPLLVRRTPQGRIRVGWNRVPSLFGGAAGTIPVRADGLRWRFAAVVAAGPCANAVLAAAAALALASSIALTPLVRTELSWVRLLSAAIFVATVVPLPNGSFVSDGLRFVRLFERGPRGDRELSLLALAAAELAGARPRDWDAAALARGLAVRDASMFECQMRLYAYMHELDSGRADAAWESLERALVLSARAPVFVREPCLVEAAYFAAAHRGDGERARELLRRVRPRTFSVLEADRLRARAAIALAEGEPDAARRLVLQALEESPPWAAGPREWLAALGVASGETAPNRANLLGSGAT